MGSGTGLADPATTRPMLSVWWLKSQQMWSLNYKKVSALSGDYQLLARPVFLITGRKQTMKLSKWDHFTLCSSSVVLLHSVRPKKSPLLQVRLLAMCRMRQLSLLKYSR